MVKHDFDKLNAGLNNVGSLIELRSQLGENVFHDFHQA
jgi:hypothetical protein